MKITNKTDVPLALAVGVLADSYDYINDPKYLSTTTLLKPVKQVILARRMENQVEDLADKVNTFIGSAVHSALEHGWENKESRDASLKKLGYKQEVIDSIVINPETPDDSVIAVYVEPPRRFKEVNGITIGGRPDLILDGRLHDYKTTSTFKWTKGDFEDYILQLSIYRWLYEDLVDHENASICFVFKDWKSTQAENNPNYPDSPLKELEISLMSLEETKQYIESRTSTYNKYIEAPEAELPRCTSEELWVDPPKYKYYSNPAKTDGRSSKNFTNQSDAQEYVAQKGKGIIITEYGKPKRCAYCPAYDICQQRREYFPEEE